MNATDAHAQIRHQINIIHAECARLGASSAKLEEATYNIDTLSRAYMEPLPGYDWGIINLSPKETLLANLLYCRLGRTVSHSSIMDALYGLRDCPGEKIIGVFIRSMRCKGLGPDKDCPFEIKTERGFGYKMVYRQACGLTKLAFERLQVLNALAAPPRTTGLLNE